MIFSRADLFWVITFGLPMVNMVSCVSGSGGWQSLVAFRTDLFDLINCFSSFLFTEHSSKNDKERLAAFEFEYFSCFKLLKVSGSLGPEISKLSCLNNQL